MSKKSSNFRKSISKKNISINFGKTLLMFRYGALKDRKEARGYCLNHKCFISILDLKEKNCNYRHCRHFKKDIKLFG